MDILAFIAWAIFGVNLLLLLVFLIVWKRDYGWKDRAQAAEIECTLLRERMADVIDAAGQASATDGGWLAKLMMRWGG